MNKITKQNMKELRQLAAVLPRTWQDGEVLATISGAALLAKGIETVDGMPVDPNKQYLRKIAEKSPVNHFRRMKKLFEKGGVPEVHKYCEGVKQLVSNSQIHLKHVSI